MRGNGPGKKGGPRRGETHGERECPQSSERNPLPVGKLQGTREKAPARGDPRRGEAHGEGRPTARGNAHGEGRPRQEGRPTARGGPGEGMPSILREKPPARRKIARDKRKSPAGEPALCGGRPPSREFPPAGGGPRRGEAHGKGRPRRGGPSIKREKPPARRKIARNGRKMPPAGEPALCGREGPRRGNGPRRGKRGPGKRACLADGAAGSPPRRRAAPHTVFEKGSVCHGDTKGALFEFA